MDVNWAKSFFEELPGIASMMRLVHFGSFTFCVAIPSLIWAVLSIWNGKLVPIDSSVATFFLGTFMIATGGKATQAIFGENNTNSTTTKT